MSPRVMWLIAIGLAASGYPGETVGQTIEEAVGRTAEGEVVFRFPIRDEIKVCDHDVQVGSRWRRGRVRRGWQERCSNGEARARIVIRQSEVRDIRLEPTGGDEPDELGLRSASEAAAFFMKLARTSPRARVAEDAVMPAVIAKGVELWPELVEIARDQRVDDDVREQAVFWLGQEVTGVGGAASEGEGGDSADVRDAAVFALSQRSEAESLPILIELARASEHPGVRRSAVFWLSQSDDPRVVDLFEELLSAGG